MSNPLLKAVLGGGIGGAIIGGFLGKKWNRKLQKVRAHDEAMQALENVGDETEPLAVPSELQVDVPGKSGDAFAPAKIVWRKTKQGKAKKP